MATVDMSRVNFWQPPKPSLHTQRPTPQRYRSGPASTITSPRNHPALIQQKAGAMLGQPTQGGGVALASGIAGRNLSLGRSNQADDNDHDDEDFPPVEEVVRREISRWFDVEDGRWVYEDIQPTPLLKQEVPASSATQGPVCPPGDAELEVLDLTMVDNISELEEGILLASEEQEQHPATALDSPTPHDHCPEPLVEQLNQEPDQIGYNDGGSEESSDLLQSQDQPAAGVQMKRGEAVAADVIREGADSEPERTEGEKQRHNDRKDEARSGTHVSAPAAPDVAVPKQLELIAKKWTKEKEILFLRYKLTKALLARDPREEEMEQISGLVSKLEGYTDLEADIIQATKIKKVLKAILKLHSIPREEVFQFKRRSQILLDKWSKLASEPRPPLPRTTDLEESRLSDLVAEPDREWEVHNIVGQKTVGDEKHYLVDWEPTLMAGPATGYNQEWGIHKSFKRRMANGEVQRLVYWEPTWMPESELEGARELVDEFEARLQCAEPQSWDEHEEEKPCLRQRKRAIEGSDGREETKGRRGRPRRDKREC